MLPWSVVSFRAVHNPVILVDMEGIKYKRFLIQFNPFFLIAWGLLLDFFLSPFHFFLMNCTKTP
jgi:hypothetical protein